MKTCTMCKAPKTLESFACNKLKKDGLQPYCRECKKLRQNAWYAKNRERHIFNVRSRIGEIRQDLHLRIFSYLQSHPCVDCGEVDPVVLDFDHVRGEKRSDIAIMVHTGFSWKTVEAEIAKCEVRCANCHRRKTAKERNTKRYRLGLEH